MILHSSVRPLFRFGLWPRRFPARRSHSVAVPAHQPRYTTARHASVATATAERDDSRGVAESLSTTWRKPFAKLDRHNDEDSGGRFYARLKQGTLLDQGGAGLASASEWSVAELRTLCSCPRCLDPSDKQLNYVFADIPSNIRVKHFEVDQEGTYTVWWENDVPGFDDHVSKFTKDDISKRAVAQISTASTAVERPLRLWDSHSFGIDESTVPYPDLMSNRESLGKVLHHLWEKGLVFISQIPEDAACVGKIAERISLLRHSFYGQTWDVRSVPQAKNVAYTSKYLGFHMDLLYMKESPGLQLLHCLQNTCTGGESRFADTFKVVARLKKENPPAHKILSEHAIYYEYDNDGYYYTDAKPVIDFDQPNQRRHVAGEPMFNRAGRVYWSPPFIRIPVKSDPNFDQGLHHTDDFIKAAKAFRDILEEPGFGIEHKLPAGTCAVFDNLRTVHARNSFDTNSGTRWLRGAYIDFQDFYSKVLAMETAGEMPPYD